MSINTAPESKEKTWAGYYNDFESLPMIHEYLNNMTEFMNKCRENFPGEKILEIGTGTGVTAVYFSQSGYSVTGLDRDPGVIAINQKMNKMFGGTARFMLGDMFKLPFPQDSFDACYHQGLMEHFDETQIIEALKIQTLACRRVVFAVPTLSWKGGLFGNERLWTGKRWLEILSPFRVVDVFGMAYSGIPRRGVNAIGRRFLHYKPTWLYRNLALNSAGEIGFAIERR